MLMISLEVKKQSEDIKEVKEEKRRQDPGGSWFCWTAGVESGYQKKS
jgi:hypothetical protein